MSRREIEASRQKESSDRYLRRLAHLAQVVARTASFVGAMRCAEASAVEKAPPNVPPALSPTCDCCESVVTLDRVEQSNPVLLLDVSMSLLEKGREHLTLATSKISAAVPGFEMQTFGDSNCDASPEALAAAESISFADEKRRSPVISALLRVLETNSERRVILVGDLLDNCWSRKRGPAKDEYRKANKAAWESADLRNVSTVQIRGRGKPTDVVVKRLRSSGASFVEINGALDDLTNQLKLEQCAFALPDGIRPRPDFQAVVLVGDDRFPVKVDDKRVTVNLTDAGDCPVASSATTVDLYFVAEPAEAAVAAEPDGSKREEASRPATSPADAPTARPACEWRLKPARNEVKLCRYVDVPGESKMKEDYCPSSLELTPPPETTSQSAVSTRVRIDVVPRGSTECPFGGASIRTCPEGSDETIPDCSRPQYVCNGGYGTAGKDGLYLSRVHMTTFEVTASGAMLGTDAMRVSPPGDQSYVRSRVSGIWGGAGGNAGVSLGVRPVRAFRAARRANSAKRGGRQKNSPSESAHARLLRAMPKLETETKLSGPIARLGPGGDAVEVEGSAEDAAQVIGDEVEQDLWPRVGEEDRNNFRKALDVLDTVELSFALLARKEVPLPSGARVLGDAYSAGMSFDLVEIGAFAKEPAENGIAAGFSRVARCSLEEAKAWAGRVPTHDEAVSALDKCRRKESRAVLGVNFVHDSIEVDGRLRQLQIHPNVAGTLRASSKRFPSLFAATGQVGMDHYLRADLQTVSHGRGRSAFSFATRADLNVRYVVLRVEGAAFRHYRFGPGPAFPRPGRRHHLSGAAAIDLVLPFGLLISPGYRAGVFDGEVEQTGFVTVGIAGADLRSRYPGIYRTLQGLGPK